MSSLDKWRNVISKMFTGKNKWITIAFIIIVLSVVSTALAYNYFVSLRMREMEDLRVLLELMEKEIKEAEETPFGGPPYLSKAEIEKAKALLSEARWFMERGDRFSAWMKLRELMFLFRKSILSPFLSGNETYRRELMLRNILLGRLERAKYWLNIFVNMYEKTSNEEVRKLLLNSTNTLKQLINEAEELIKKNSYFEAERKLNEAFRIINETLRSLKIILSQACFKKT
jgi:hypothetical protein